MPQRCCWHPYAKPGKWTLCWHSLADFTALLCSTITESRKLYTHAGAPGPAQQHAAPPQSAFSQPAAQREGGNDTVEPQDSAAAASAAERSELSQNVSAQLTSASSLHHSGISPHHSGISPHHSGFMHYSNHPSHDAEALASFAQSAAASSPLSEHSEAQVRNTLTAASQPLPPQVTAQADAKAAVDDRFVTMSSADALEEAVQHENNAAGGPADPQKPQSGT